MTDKPDDIVFQEERAGEPESVILLERRNGAREWYWKHEIPPDPGHAEEPKPLPADYWETAK